MSAGSAALRNIPSGTGGGPHRPTSYMSATNQTHPNINGMGNTLGIVPGGRNWNVALPWSSDLARSDLDPTELTVRTAMWPADFVSRLLPYIMSLERRQNTGGTVKVWLTERLQGILHYNAANNHRLTLGVVKTLEREIEFTTFSTDLETLRTPELYRIKMPLENPLFVDEMKRIWSAAHGRVVAAYELMARLVMRRDLATIWNLAGDERMMLHIARATYWICNRLPQDAVTAIMTCVTAAALEAHYQTSQIGNILLLPLQAAVEKSMLFGSEGLSKYDKDRQVERTLTNVYQVAPNEYVGVVSKAAPSLKVGNYEVVFYDSINNQGQLSDAFTQSRIFGAAVVVSDNVSKLSIKTPKGNRTIRNHELALAAGLFHPSEGVMYGANRTVINGAMLAVPPNSKNAIKALFQSRYYSYLEQNGAAKGDGPLQTAFPSIAGAYAFQTHEAARLLVRWLAEIAKKITENVEAVRLEQAAAVPAVFPNKTNLLLNTVIRNTGVKLNITGAPGAVPGSMTYTQFVDAILDNPWHSFLRDTIFDAADELNAMVLLLCALPGTNVVVEYLSSVVPFSICNFVYYIVGSAITFDGYVIQSEAPVHCITSDPLVGTFTDSENYSVPRHNIEGRAALYTHSKDLNFRVPDVFTSQQEFDTRIIGRPGDVPRRNRLRSGTKGQYDTFAVFSGVGSTLPPWCQNGWDSIVDMPTPEEIRVHLFPGVDQNAAQTAVQERVAEIMIEGLAAGDWTTVVQDDENDYNQSTDANNRKWYPWPAVITSDNSQTILAGLGQLETYHASQHALSK